MDKLELFWMAKEKLQANEPLTTGESTAILSVLREAESVIVPSRREAEVYTEAKHALNQCKEESLVDYFEPVVKQFENKYKKLVRVA